MSKYPQTTRNIPIAGHIDLESDDALRTAVAEAEAGLGTDGRVLLRQSGTEPLVRVMVEGTSLAAVRRQADRLADAVSATAATSKR